MHDNSTVCVCLWVLCRWWAMQLQPSQPVWCLFVSTENTTTSWRLLHLNWGGRYPAARSEAFVLHSCFLNFDFSSTPLISLIGRCWWTSATTSRRIYTQRLMLSICRGKKKWGNKAITWNIGIYGTSSKCCLLSRLTPGSHVVKAFNTLSAWALQNGPSDANRQVLVLLLFCFQTMSVYLNLKTCSFWNGTL